MARIHACSWGFVERRCVGGRLERVEGGQALGVEIVADQVAVLRLELVVVGIGLGVEARQRRVVGGRALGEREAHRRRQRAQQAALLRVAGRDRTDRRRVARHAGVAHDYVSCSIVAHSPCSCRRKTSSSAFSLGPLDTTALPFWCTSSMSRVAFSLE